MDNREAEIVIGMGGEESVIIFDFDRTLIEDDSDRWVLTNMGLTDLFNRLRPTMPWNSLMDRMLGELHLQGRTVDDIADCLKRVVMHPDIISVIKSARALGCDLKVVSDSNLFYIKIILENYDVYDCFSEIITNPGVVDENGRLRIFPFHDDAISPHGCNLCSPNLCKLVQWRYFTILVNLLNRNYEKWSYDSRRAKVVIRGGQQWKGLVVKQIQACISEGKTKRLIYVGDGRNDFCPTLKLVAGDCVMPKRNFPLWGQIMKNSELVTANVYDWVSGEDLAKTLHQLINNN